MDRNIPERIRPAGSRHLNLSAWSLTIDEIIKTLNTDGERGLSQAEAADRLKRYGSNERVQERKVTFWGIFREEITEPLILLLLVVGIFYSVWGELRDTLTIFSVIVLLILSEIFTEYRAKRAVASLKKLSPPTTPVTRDGVYSEYLTSEIVQGDLLKLEVGGIVPADSRLVEAIDLEVNESSLTGE